MATPMRQITIVTYNTIKLNQYTFKRINVLKKLPISSAWIKTKNINGYEK